MRDSRQNLQVTRSTLRALLNVFRGVLADNPPLCALLLRLLRQAKGRAFGPSTLADEAAVRALTANRRPSDPPPADAAAAIAANHGERHATLEELAGLLRVTVTQLRGRLHRVFRENEELERRAVVRVLEQPERKRPTARARNLYAIELLWELLRRRMQ